MPQNSVRFLFVITAYNARPYVPPLVESVAGQSWPAWRAVFVDDGSTDGTPQALREVLAARGLTDRFEIVVNPERRYKARNLFESLSRQVEPDVVAVILDGDDSLDTPHALARLAREYEQGWEIVWSNWRGSDGSRGTSAHLHPFLCPRRQPFVSSHLFSFRLNLFDAVTEADLQDDEGKWFEAGCDVALAWPLLALTIKRRHIEDVLCVYNRANPLSHDKQNPGDRPYVSPRQARTSAILRRRPATATPVDQAFLQSHLYEFLNAAAESTRLMTRLEIARASVARPVSG